MTLEEQISRQRVKHIVSSYDLTGEEIDRCTKYVDELLQTYAPALIELALTHTIVQNWLTVPMPRGMAFFDQVRDVLIDWQANSIQINFTPDEFQQITGLDPTPIFGSSGFQPPPSIVRHG
jgi:hypothetical protein